jgi:dTMP kinase
MPNPRPRGLLIAFEGIDGGGKTTQATRLRDHLVALGREVVLTKEPTNGPWGQRLRASAKTGRLPPEEELDLFLRDRAEHVTDEIQPALDRGAVVIIDRYYPSTVAYQGIRGWDPAELRARNEAFAPRPDLLVILDIAAERGLGRVASRGDTADAFERVDLLDRSRVIFQSMRDWPGALLIDATQPLEQVERRVHAALQPLLER